MNRRKRVFVGRAAEIAAIEAACTSDEEAPVFRVSGATGVGKTSLLVEIEARCAIRNAPFRRFDLARGEVSPEALEGAIADLVSASNGVGHPVLLVDDVHTSRPLERWLAGRLGRTGPAPLTVFTDRRATSHTWYEGGAAQVEEIALRPFGPAEVEAFFEASNVEPSRRSSVRRFAAGHPLLLTLAASTLEWDDADIETSLLVPLSQALCSMGDTREKRLAFALLVTCDGTSYEMLAHAVGDEAVATATFHWLQSLPLLDETSRGLVPHHVVRRACAAYIKTHHPSLAEAATLAVASFGQRRRPIDASSSLVLASQSTTSSARPSGEAADGDEGWTQPERPIDDGYFGPERTTAVMRLARVGAEDELEYERPSAIDATRGASFRELLQRRLDELARTAVLTEREREVFQLLVLGRNTNEIGMVLGITARTAKFHQQRVLEKIGADGRADILRVLL